jgi:hypothetical protein
MLQSDVQQSSNMTSITIKSDAIIKRTCQLQIKSQKIHRKALIRHRHPKSIKQQQQSQVAELLHKSPPKLNKLCIIKQQFALESQQ